MYFFFSLIPAMVWLALGYFILYASTKAEGPTQIFGRILTIWVFVIAAFFPVIGAYVTSAGLSPIGDMMQSMHAGVSP